MSRNPDPGAGSWLGGWLGRKAPSTPALSGGWANRDDLTSKLNITLARSAPPAYTRTEPEAGPAVGSSLAVAGSLAVASSLVVASTAPSASTTVASTAPSASTMRVPSGTSSSGGGDPTPGRGTLPAPGAQPGRRLQPFPMPPPADAMDPLLGHPTYQTVKALGRGSFGFVLLAQHKGTGELVAIKLLERTDQPLSGYVQSEILNHRRLRHFHVIELKGVFSTPQHLGLVMEYANSGDLLSFVQNRPFRHLDEVTARWFFQQLIIGLDYCHRRGVVNRDIKLDNTLLHMMPGMPLPLIKICDFGLSKGHLMSAPHTQVGSLAYMAPEIITVKGGAYDGKRSDMWSCGVMLYAMLFGQYPFSRPRTAAQSAADRGANDRMKMQQMAQRIVDADWTVPADRRPQVSSSFVDLLGGILVADPLKRMTMEQVVGHPWFTSHLPPGALAMNANVHANDEEKGIQTVAEIQLLLQQCQAPPPSDPLNPDASGGACVANMAPWSSLLQGQQQ